VGQVLHEMIRKEVPFLEEDRELRLDVDAMNAMVRRDDILETVTAILPVFS